MMLYYTKINLILMIVLIFIQACSSGQLGFRQKDGDHFHLIVDAGSSGTRFCIYRMEKIAEPHQGSYCRAEPVEGKYGKCKSIYAENGIAYLGEQKGPPVVLKGISELELSNPGVTGKIHQTAFLGTGGFRKIGPTQSEPILIKLRKILADNKMPSVVKIISGEQEAEYAYASVTHIANDQSFGMIEIGGASSQVAYQSTTGMVNISEPIGVNTAYKKMVEEPDYQDECFQPPSPFFIRKGKAGLSLQTCQAKVAERIFATSGWKTKLASIPAGTKFYGLGKLWAAKFGYHDREEFTMEFLQKVGEQACQMTVEELVDEGIAKKFAARECFTYSYIITMMQTLSIDKIYSGRGESYPRGSAISVELFPDCANASRAVEPGK